MTPAELWNSNPAELNDRIEGKMEMLEVDRTFQNVQSARVCAALGNYCGGGKKTGGPFTVQDFMPVREDPRKRTVPQSPEQQAFLLKLFAAIQERESRRR
jgi:hypothetical protein